MPPKKPSSKAATQTHRDVALASIRVVRGDLERMNKALDRIERAIKHGKFRLYAVALAELNTMSQYVQDAVRAIPTSVGQLAFSIGCDKAQRKGRAR